MEQPDYHYTDHDVIEANNRAEACEIYDKKHKCSYFYGTVLKEITENDLK